MHIVHMYLGIYVHMHKQLCQFFCGIVFVSILRSDIVF